MPTRSTTQRPGSAEIIRFPTRPSEIVPPFEPMPVPDALSTVAETPAERLHRALQMLEAAQAEQRVAIAKWRGALNDLSASVNSIGTSLNRFEVRLGQTATRLFNYT